LCESRWPHGRPVGLFFARSQHAAISYADLYEQLTDYQRSAIAGAVKELIKLGAVKEEMTTWPRRLKSQNIGEVMGFFEGCNENVSNNCDPIQCGFSHKLTKFEGILDDETDLNGLKTSFRPFRNESAVSYRDEIAELVEIGRKCGFLNMTVTYSLCTLKSLANSHKIHTRPLFLLIKELREEYIRLSNKTPKLRAPSLWNFIELLEKEYFASNTTKPWEPASVDITPKRNQGGAGKER
jgi:hypothetical protein